MKTKLFWLVVMLVALAPIINRPAHASTFSAPIGTETVVDMLAGVTYDSAFISPPGYLAIFSTIIPSPDTITLTITDVQGASTIQLPLPCGNREGIQTGFCGYIELIPGDTVDVSMVLTGDPSLIFGIDLAPTTTSPLILCQLVNGNCEATSQPDPITTTPLPPSVLLFAGGLAAMAFRVLMMKKQGIMVSAGA
jgi:hypothetical protein